MATSEARSYRPGDVVVVPLPYSDRFAEKRRPALCDQPRDHIEGFARRIRHDDADRPAGVRLLRERRMVGACQQQRRA